MKLANLRSKYRANILRADHHQPAYHHPGMHGSMYKIQAIGQRRDIQSHSFSIPCQHFIDQHSTVQGKDA